jgi:hypothetical protein
MIGDEIPPQRAPVESSSPAAASCYQVFPPAAVKDFIQLLSISFTCYILITGLLYQASHGRFDFLASVKTNSQKESHDLRSTSLLHVSGSSASNVSVDEQVQTGGATTSITTSRGGPVPFCHMPFKLYRTDIRDMICDNKNKTFGIITQSNQEQFQFLHIPKTGGESLEDTLNIHKSHDTWWQRREWYTENKTRHGLSITIIRNPFDRMYSWFKFCLHGWKRHLPGPPEQCLKAHTVIHSHEGLHNLTCVSLAFEEWIQNIFLDPNLSHPWITLSAHEFLGGITPLHVDYIIRFEHYSEDYEILAHALGRNASLVHDNGSSSNDRGQLNGHNKYNLTYDKQVGEILQASYRDVYTDVAKNIVELHFASDLITFNYTF